MVPEARPVAIANGDPSGGVEKQTIHVVAWHVCAHPRLWIVSPLLPEPPEARSSTKPVQVQHTHTPQLLGPADHWLVHQIVSLIVVLLSVLKE